MAPSFGRTISFPLSPARASRPRAAAYHVRSVSLPCNSHPLLAHLCNHITAVRSWVAAPSSPSTGLAHLDALHAALAELLLLPEARSALHHGSATATCLLDGFLLLADAHAAFQETVVELRAHASDAQAALRRRDDARLTSAVRSLRRAEKDLARLAASVLAAAKFPTMPSASSSSAEVEVSGALAEAVAAATCASAAVFSAVEAVSAVATSALASKKTMTSSLMSLVKSAKPASSNEEKEVAALERLDEVEACVAEIEGASEKVFRSILHTRVALLNIQTETCC
ncbi:uncharacterized protein [Lolium perenne]|uniref:uncharacterized protein n=1 Tax=Lolium perenne TaxID=4522 RepID=UPI0021EA5008|nr:uncharacterized protein LOC127313037 [Lolium perenne]